MKLAVDVSSHNNISPSQWDALATVTDGVIVRLSYGVTQDIAAEDHIAAARARSLAVAGYHWSDPTWDFQRQLSVALYTIKLHGVAGWFSDVEQFWSDWAAWARGDVVALAASKIAPDKLNTFYKYFVTAVDAGTDKPVGSYSGQWFIDAFCPQLANWIYANNYWGASYVSYEAWWAKYLLDNPLIDAAKLHTLANNNIFIYRGIGRQWTSKLPGAVGIPVFLDYNVFTDEGFLRMFGAPGKPDGDVIPEPVVTSYITLDDVWVRDVPNGTNKVGYRHRGETVTAYDKSMGWVLVEPITDQGGAKGWIAGAFLAPTGSMYKVTALSLWIRSAPYVGDNKIGYLWLGATVQVDKIGLNGWVHIVARDGKPAGWVSMAYLVSV